MATGIEVMRHSESQGLEPSLPTRASTLMRKSLDARFWGLDTKQHGQLLDLHKDAGEVMRELHRLELERQFEARNSKVDEDLELSHHVCSDEYFSRMDDLQLRMRENNVRLEELAKQCAVLQCNAFTTIVGTSLPRELRDQIYDYLWDSDDVEELDSILSYKYAPPWLSSDDIASVDISSHVPFFADPTFVDGGFANEAAMWYFKMLTSAEINYRHVRGYLQRNTFGSMELVLWKAIRRLTIDVGWSVHGGEQLAYAALRDSMNSLLMLQDHENFTIEVYLSRDIQFSSTLFHVLDIIKPIFHTLERKGPTLKVMGYQFFTPRWKEEHEMTAEKKTRATVELMNYYFQVTSGEWLALKETEIKSIPQARRREKCYDVLKTMRTNLRDAQARNHEWSSFKRESIDRNIIFRQHGG